MLQQHLRNTFLAGVFAAIPLAVTGFVIWYVEKVTRDVFGAETPFVGVGLAILAIYLLGLFVRSLVGGLLLRQVDSLLLKAPVLKELYRAWKQVSLIPGGRGGMFAKVVLAPADASGAWMLGFSSGEPLEGDPLLTCVFVPNAPNPVNGRLYFVRLADLQWPAITPEEAFKLLLSGGNYLPDKIGAK